jgi:RNA-splicing ligase RtcB
VALQALKPKSFPRRRTALDASTGRGLTERNGEVFSLDILSHRMSGLAEEAPTAYKDVSRVVEVVHKAGIARKIARLEPIAVIKG